MEKFIRPLQDRCQATFLRETLDETVPRDHPIRSVDYIIRLFDFSCWESEYPGGGRPSYPPDKMCGLLIYGNMMSIRSSRKLEYACLNNRDFIWFMEGLAPDHDTIADFRKRYGDRFKDIFRQTLKVGLEAGLISMKSLSIDGSKIRSNSSKWNTKSRKDLIRLLKEIDARIEEMLQECDKVDQSEDDLFGKGESPNRLPPEMKDLEKQRELLEKAHERVKEKEERAKQQHRMKNEKRVPATDPDSDVMKCKRGGYAPNYNVQIVVDCGSGIIVGEDVSDRHTDEKHLQELYEQVVDDTGLQPEQILADSGYATSGNLEYLDKAGVDACMPPVHTNFDKKSEEQDDSNEDWPDDVPTTALNKDGELVDGTKIPRNAFDKFDKSAFKYDDSMDCYICPMGHELVKCGKTFEKRDQKFRYRYRCKACGSCPFKPVCSDAKYRSVVRMDDAWIQERQKIIMDDPDRRRAYRVRACTVEPVFGNIKSIQGVEQFLTRGLGSVKVEWSLATIAHNFRKLVKRIDVVKVAC